MVATSTLQRRVDDPLTSAEITTLLSWAESTWRSTAAMTHLAIGLPSDVRADLGPAGRWGLVCETRIATCPGIICGRIDAAQYFSVYRGHRPGSPVDSPALLRQHHEYAECCTRR